MKKFIIALATMAMLSFSATAAATNQVVQVVWPFAPGSAQATRVRHLIESANQQQQRFQFVFVHKPGAGGTIAANYTSSASTLTVLASSDSFYTRPMMYHESHDLNKFLLVNAICSKSPLAMFSRKYSTVPELKAQNVTVGVIPGSVTQLFVQQLSRNNPGFKFTEVPYKGTTEATTDMLGKHIDASVDLIGQDALARLLPGTSVVGITGNRSLPNMPSMASQQIRGVDQLTMSYYLFVPATVDSVVTQELTQIFNAAINDAVRKTCADESGVVEIVTADKTKQLHQANIKRWQDLTQGIEKQ
jgi:tripartite-type tricarboxylate transporter receptor subunit TctC